MVITREPLSLEKWNLVHLITSSCWSHAIAYSKTPPITVAAILKSTVFSLTLLIFENWSKSSQNWLRWYLDWAEQNLLNKKKIVIFVQKLWCYELNEVDPILVQRLYLGQTLTIKTKLVMHHQHMIWGPRPKLRIAPPMGREIPTIHILAYNFWTVSQKIKISVSMDSLCRAESEDVNYQDDWTPVGHFEIVIHFHIFWTIWHIITKIGRDHQHHVRIPQKYEDSATYCSRDITIIGKNA